jgi:hypothetical protein
MAIKYDNYGTPGSLTIGNNARRILIIYTAYQQYFDSPPAPAAPTFNGVSATYAFSVTTGLYGQYNQVTNIYYISNPNVGSHTLSGGLGLSLYDVNTASPFGFSTSAHGDTDITGSSVYSISLSSSYTSSGLLEICSELGTQYFNSLSAVSNGLELPDAIYSDLNGISKGSWNNAIPGSVGRSAHSTYASTITGGVLEIRHLESPSVTTQSPTNQPGLDYIVGNGTIIDTGGDVGDTIITEIGFVWSTTTHTNPGNVAPGSTSYSGFVSVNGNFGTGTFIGNLTGLSNGVLYYVRAYAASPLGGYSYGDESTITPSYQSAFLGSD